MPIPTPSGYDPAYCEAVVEHCRQDGTLTSFAAGVGVSAQTITRWARQFPEFKLAVEKAKAVCPRTRQRPPSRYDPSHCDALVDHCRQNGTFASFAASVGVKYCTLASWSRKYPEFKLAARTAKEVGPRAGASTFSRYDPAYCEMVVEHCRSGASLISFAASIGVSGTTLRKWRNAHEAFADAIERAKAAAAAWYDEKARDMVGGARGNAALCMLALRNLAPDDFGEFQQQRRFPGEELVSEVVLAYVAPSDPDA